MKKSRIKASGPFKLNVTSLMDMFTIILVFLLVSMSEEDKDFVLEEGLELPHSEAQGMFEPAVNVVVSDEFIKVGANIVARLSGGQVSAEQSKTGRIEAVVRAVRRAREQREQERQDRSRGEDEEDIIMVQADRSLPYKTVYLVMRSCSIAGYSRYRLAIEKE